MWIYTSSKFLYVLVIFSTLISFFLLNYFIYEWLKKRKVRIISRWLFFPWTRGLPYLGRWNTSLIDNDEWHGLLWTCSYIEEVLSSGFKTLFSVEIFTLYGIPSSFYAVGNLAECRYASSAAWFKRVALLLIKYFLRAFSGVPSSESPHPLFARSAYQRISIQKWRWEVWTNFLSFPCW